MTERTSGIRAFLVRAGAFLRRDAIFHWSYKFGVLYEAGAILSTLATLLFVGRMMAEAPPPTVVAYGTDYFTFALVGVTFADYMRVSMGTFASGVRTAQMMGTLETMLAAPVQPFWIVLHSGTYAYLRTFVRSAVFLGLGIGFLGASFPAVNIPAVVSFTVLTVLAFAGIGLASAAMTLYLKQSDPLTSLIAGLSYLFGGIVYPVQSLPPLLQDVAWCLPMTHAVEGLRRAMLSGAGVADLGSHAIVLTLWAAASFPLSWLLLKWVIRRLSREGSFGSY